MARKRIKMNKLREILRLHNLEFSNRKIARLLNISRPAVSNYIKRFKNTGLKHSEIKNLVDENILELLSITNNDKNEKYKYLESQFEYYCKELKRRGVTKGLLWEEYKIKNPDGFGRSQFNHYYQLWCKQSKLSMHINHKAGDKMFVDFTGQKWKIYDKDTDRLREVEIFIAILGASRLTYVEAVESQKKEDWIKVNVNALNYFGGVPQAIVPDNLKSAINKASKYEPDVNELFYDFSLHYDTVILPARPYKPKDKPLVEGAVRIAYTRIFAPLRNEKYYSLGELNTAIKEKLEKLNNALMQHLKISRRELFNDIEIKTLKPLPIKQYEIRKIQIAKIQFNYHVYLSEDKHYYSVPFRFRGREAKIAYNQGILEIFVNNNRIVTYQRDRRPHSYTTLSEHMPPNHQWIQGWNPEKFINWADSIGEHVRNMITEILKSKKHPEQAYKVCMGILNLPKQFGERRLNKACKKALHFNIISYKGIKNILVNKLEESWENDLFDEILPPHENIRGSDYFLYKGVNNEY